MYICITYDSRYLLLFNTKIIFLYFPRVRRYSKFFGPNVKAEVYKVDAKQRIVALKLTTVSAVMIL